MKNSGAMKENRGNTIVVLLLFILGVLVFGPVVAIILFGAFGSVVVTVWAVGIGIAILMGLFYAVMRIYEKWPIWRHNRAHRSDIDDESGWSKPRPRGLKKG